MCPNPVRDAHNSIPTRVNLYLLNQSQGADMTTTSIVLIVVVAIAAIVLIAAIAWVARNKRNQHRHIEADKIREAAKEETLQEKQREADVKAAQASGLQQQAAAHRSGAATSRDQLNEQWDRADKMDPASQTSETPRTPDRKEQTPRTADRKEHQDH